MVQRGTSLVSAEIISVRYIPGTDYLAIFTLRPDKPIPFKPGQYVNLSMEKPALIDLVKDASDIDKNDPDYQKKLEIISQERTLIERDGRTQRQYSISSPPHALDGNGNVITYNDGNIELYIIRVDKDGIRKDGRGLVTTELFKPEEERKDVKFYFNQSAKGLFLLPEHEKPARDDKRARIMAATGTGLATYMSMLLDPTTRIEDIKFVLIHGVANTRDHAYREEIAGIQHAGVDLTYIPVSSREPTQHSQKYVEEFFFNRDRLKTGRVTDEEVKRAIEEQAQLHNPGIEDVLSHKLSAESDILMVCGNPGMIKSLESIAKALGFKLRVDFKREDYW